MDATVDVAVDLPVDLPVDGKGGRRIDYAYDASGLRTEKRVNGRVVAEYLWLDPLRLGGFHDGQQWWRLIYGQQGRSPLGLENGRERYLLLCDQVGTPLVLANLDGSIVQHMRYDSSGNLLAQTGNAVRLPLGFAGGLFDEGTGLTRFVWRDYEADTGRSSAPAPRLDAPSRQRHTRPMTLMGYDLEGQVIRPPAEAESILLQVSLGCSHNKCDFCPAYKGKRFAIKSPERIKAALDHAARHLADLRRLFLCDGDALILPQERLEALLADIRTRLPQVTRIAAYANAKALSRKTAAELSRLRSLGLSTLYLGLESGDDATLADMHKWGDVGEHLRQAAKAKEAGLKLSVTVLLGLGGLARSREHALATGRALSQMDPEQAAALALMIVPGTPLYERLERGEFNPQDDQGLLQELFWLLEATNLSSGLFFSNHASNPLRLKLRLPRDKQAGLALIQAALNGQTPLVPKAYRGL